MTLLYKVLYREANEVQFRDTGEWVSCDDCITKMRSLLSQDPLREFQIVDDHGVVVVSSLAEQKAQLGSASV